MRNGGHVRATQIDVGTGTGSIVGNNPFQPKTSGTGINTSGIAFSNGQVTLSAVGGTLTLTGSGDSGVSAYASGSLYPTFTINGAVNISANNTGQNANFSGPSNNTWGVYFGGNYRFVNTGNLSISQTAANVGGANGVYFGANSFTNNGTLTVAANSPLQQAMFLGSLTNQTVSGGPAASVVINTTSPNLAFNNGGVSITNGANVGNLVSTIRINANGRSWLGGSITNLASALGSDNQPSVSFAATTTYGTALEIVTGITATGAVTLSGTNLYNKDTSGYGPGIDVQSWPNTATGIFLAHKNVGNTQSTLTLNGYAKQIYSPGVYLSSVNFSGAVTVNGNSDTATGVDLSNATWTAAATASASDSGPLVINGASGTGIGVNFGGTTLSNTAATAVTITGTSTSGVGVQLLNSTINNTYGGTLTASGISSRAASVSHMFRCISFRPSLLPDDLYQHPLLARRRCPPRH